MFKYLQNNAYAGSRTIKKPCILFILFCFLSVIFCGNESICLLRSYLSVLFRKVQKSPCRTNIRTISLKCYWKLTILSNIIAQMLIKEQRRKIHYFPKYNGVWSTTKKAKFRSFYCKYDIQVLLLHKANKIILQT